MAKIVELKDVTKVYKTGEREFRALDGVDLSIEKGKFVVILGPSGAGKSTLLNLIGGMDIPTTGQVVVDGEDISKYNEDKLSRYRAATVGFIFQFYNILPTLTVLENVELDESLAENVLKIEFVEDFFDDETGRTNKYPVHEEDSVIVF